MADSADSAMTAGRRTAARVLAVTGTVLVGFPLAAPIALAAFLLVRQGGLHVDYLMPGELFPVILVGGIVLVVVAFLVGRRRVLIGTMVAVAALLFGSVTVLATTTGIASGATAATGFPLAIVVAAYVLYVAFVVALFTIGVMFCREAFSRAAAASTPPRTP